MANIVDQSQYTNSEWADHDDSKLEIFSSRHVKAFQKFTVRNPHPGFGKDPNIINELGHTRYPKWVDSKKTGTRIVVQNPMEEAQHLGEEVKEPVSPKTDAWTL
jgi:hypothetical protein